MCRYARFHHAGLFRARWIARLLDKWTRTLLDRKPYVERSAGRCGGARIAERDAGELFLTAISEAEFLYGVVIMPASFQRVMQTLSKVRGVLTWTNS